MRIRGPEPFRPVSGPAGATSAVSRHTKTGSMIVRLTSPGEWPLSGCARPATPAKTACSHRSAIGPSSGRSVLGTTQRKGRRRGGLLQYAETNQREPGIDSRDQLPGDRSARIQAPAEWPVRHWRGGSADPCQSAKGEALALAGLMGADRARKTIRERNRCRTSADNGLACWLTTGSACRR